MEFTERVEIQEENTNKEIQIEEDASSNEIEIQNDFSMKEIDIQDGYFHDYNDNKIHGEKTESEKNETNKKYKLIRQLSDNISQNAKILCTTVKLYSNMEQNKRNKVKDHIVNLKRDLGGKFVKRVTSFHFFYLIPIVSRFHF